MKVKLTKGELKRQRDALRQYERYLPTLQLKKQQLQLEILHQQVTLDKERLDEEEKMNNAMSWAGLLSDVQFDPKKYVKSGRLTKDTRNIAGADIPLFVKMDFPRAEYDLFITPLWIDAAIDALREIETARKKIEILEEGVRILKHELRITTQRVNLFEKIKIPEAKEAIRLIKIYIGDQMANTVGRSKI
ncbi:MAG: V-type ATP synthase subunit D, partial [Candidatus Omnitrophica bacterium]|nr:V-type ATP synthase subunit D [Candidatus Omnitrophota bacterium]